MKGTPSQLGDSHNFGRRVVLRGERIEKPRTLLWEWLLLSRQSPLRQLLDRAAAQDALGVDAFGFLPALEFFGSRGAGGGQVERLQLEPLRTRDTETRRALATIVGRSLALWSWLGVADLHWENLVLGVDEQGRVVFGPLDIEMILADLSLPTETKLLPDADPEYAAICRHASGVRRVLPYLGKPIDVGELLVMAGAYRRTLAFLDRHSQEIADVLSALPELREAPLRVLLRGTGDYVQSVSSSLWPPLLEAEIEQLARGDIPYFFRLYGRPGIHYYADATLSRIASLPLHGDVPQLDPILQLSRGLRSPSRKKLREDGLFTLLGAFDHQSFTGTHVGEELSLTFSKRNLVVTLPSGEELRTSRNLRAFVGSVYLPCECGEVSSVFVPPVSVCAAAQSSV
ncbi:MAG TPA: hypothetical protein VER11_21860 [Polyangiaceae bacterium]|nr:hypothetical protein [Polyangiaceae bacterium]